MQLFSSLLCTPNHVRFRNQKPYRTVPFLTSISSPHSVSVWRSNLLLISMPEPSLLLSKHLLYFIPAPVYQYSHEDWEKDHHSVIIFSFWFLYFWTVLLWLPSSIHLGLFRFSMLGKIWFTSLLKILFLRTWFFQDVFLKHHLLCDFLSPENQY